MNIMISLEKQYLDQIRSGIKKFEYRRRFVDQPCRAYLYITAPFKAVMGYIDLGKPIIGTPEEISKLAESHREGIGDEIFEYMQSSDKGYAIPILKLVELEKVSLDYLNKNFDFTAPQGYMIIDKKPKLLAKLESLKILK
jgi:predicted transcriptional regulator